MVLDKSVVMIKDNVKAVQRMVNKHYAPYNKTGFDIEDIDFSLITSLKAESMYGDRKNRYYYREVDLIEQVDADKLLAILENCDKLIGGWKICFPLKDTSIVVSQNNKLKTIKFPETAIKVEHTFSKGRIHALINDYISVINLLKFDGKSYKFGKIGTLLSLSTVNDWYYSKIFLNIKLRIKK
jgi:hypothetical protein